MAEDITTQEVEQVDNTQQQLPEQPPKKLSVKDFAAKIKEKYPEYNSVADEVLVNKMIEKYPVYKDQVDISQKKNLGKSLKTGAEESSDSITIVPLQSESTLPEEPETQETPKAEVTKGQPPIEDDDYIGLSKQAKKLTSPTPISIPVAGGAVQYAVSPENEKQANVIKEKVKAAGFNPDKLANDTDGINDVFFKNPQYNYNQLLVDYKTNPQLYERKIATAKSQSEIYNASPEASDVVAIAKSNISNPSIDYNTKRDNIKDIVRVVNNLDVDNDKKNSILNNLYTEFGYIYGSSKVPVDDELLKTGLNENQVRAYHSLQDINPSAALKYKTALLSDVEVGGDYNIELERQLERKRLDEIGLSMKKNWAIENINKQKDYYQDLYTKAEKGLATPEELENLTETEKILQPYRDAYMSADNEEKEFSKRYPYAVDKEASEYAEDLVGQKHGYFTTMGANYGKAWLDAGQGLYEGITTPFKTDIERQREQARALGIEAAYQREFHMTPDKFKEIREGKEINPYLKTEIDKIINNTTLTYEQKLKRTHDLLIGEPTSEWRKVGLEEPKSNISGTSLLYGMSNMAVNLLPYITIEGATGGEATGTIVPKFAKAFTAGVLTGFHEQYMNALEKGSSNPYADAALSTAIFSAAMAVGDAPDKIKKALGNNTAIGKLINSLEDKDISNLLKNSTEPTALKILKNTYNVGANIVGEVAKGVKPAAGFTAAMTGGRIVNDAILNQVDTPENYAKGYINQLVDFVPFNALMGIGGKTIRGEMAEAPQTTLTRDAIFDAATNYEEHLRIVDKNLKNGVYTPEQANQIRNNITSAKNILATTPMLDAKGNKLSLDSQKELLILKMQEASADAMLQKDIPKELASDIGERINKLHDKMDAIYKGTYLFEKPKTKENDKENISGIPSGIGVGEEPIETKPIEGGGTQEISSSGVLQTPGAEGEREGVEGKVGEKVMPEFKDKSDADIENRMAEIEGDASSQDEFNSLEKEMEKREWNSVFGTSLDNVENSVDALLKKEKDKPNGYGAFIEKRDARETKEVANRYLNAKELTDSEVKKDFSDALRGNPTTWYADGLKLRESLKEAASRGIDTKDMVNEAIKVYTNDGYTLETAKKVVAIMLKPIFEGATEAKPELPSTEAELPEQKEAPKLEIEAEAKLPPTKEPTEPKPVEPAEPAAKPTEAKPELPEQTALEKAREARKAAKEKLNAIRRNLGIVKDPKQEAEALYEYHKALVTEAKEYIKAGIKSVEEWAKEVGEKVNVALQSAWDEATGKTSPTEKAEDLKYTADQIEPSKVSGVKKAVTEPLRESFGLPKVELPKMGSDVEELQQAKERVDNGESNPRKMVDDILDNDRGYKDEKEVMDMQYYAHQLNAKDAELTKMLADASNDVEKAAVVGLKQQLSDEIDRQTEAARRAGNKWGKIGKTMQPVIDDGFNISRERNLIKEAYGGELPEHVKEKIDSITKERDEAIAEREKVEKKLIEERAKKEIEKKAKESKAEKGKTKKTKEEFIKERQSIVDRIKKKWKDAKGGGAAYSSLVPIPIGKIKQLAAISPEVGELIKSHVEEGIDKLSDIVDSIHGLLKDEVSELTKSDVTDLIAGKYSIGKERSEVAKKVAEIRNEAKRLQKENRTNDQKIQDEIDKLNKKADALEEKIKNAPSEKIKDEFNPYDNSEWVKADQRVANAEKKMRDLKRQAFESQKNWYQKGLMWAGRGIRLSLLSGYNVLAKLGAAATIGGALKRIPEQAIGSIYNLAFKKIAEKAPIEGSSMNLNSELKWYKEFFNPKKFAKNSWDILKSGTTYLNKKMGKSEYDHVPLLYLPTDLHQIIKDPVKRSTYESSFANAMRWADKQGLDITNDLVIQSLQNAAFKRAEYEIFQESNALTRKFTAWKNEMEKKGNVGATYKFLADFMIPVSSVPTNIARRLGITSPFGLLKANADVIKAYREGIENLKPEDADRIMRQLKQGSLGTALWLIGWLGVSNFGGLYTKFNPNKKREDEDLSSDEMIVNGKSIPKPVQHALPLEIIQLAATSRRLWDKYNKDVETSTPEAIYKAGLASIGAVAEQIPIIETPVHMVMATQDPYEAGKLGEDIKGRFQPQILKETGIIKKEEPRKLDKDELKQFSNLTDGGVSIPELGSRSQIRIKITTKHPEGHMTPEEYDKFAPLVKKYSIENYNSVLSQSKKDIDKLNSLASKESKTVQDRMELTKLRKQIQSDIDETHKKAINRAKKELKLND